MEAAYFSYQNKSSFDDNGSNLRLASKETQFWP